METTTTPAPQTTETPSTEQPVTESKPESSQQAETDPNESFSDWLRRQPGSKTEEVPKSESGRDEKGRFVAKAKDTNKQEVSENDTNSTQKSVPEVEKSPEPELKVGDKAFKAKDIETLNKSYEEMRTAHETLNSQVRDLVETLKNNPGAVLDHLGISKNLIESYYYDKYVQPEVFKSLPAEQKVAHYEKLEQDRLAAEQAKQAEQARLEQEAKVKAAETESQKLWSQRFTEALNEAGIPNTQWAHQQMAAYVKQAQDKNIQITAKDLVPLVKADLVEAKKAALEGITPEEITALLGQDMMSKIRAQDVAKFKQEQFENKTPLKAKVERSEKPKKRLSSIYELLD